MRLSGLRQYKFDKTHQYSAHESETIYVHYMFFCYSLLDHWTLTKVQKKLLFMSQRINLGNVLWLTARLCKISGDGSGRYFRTFRILFHSTKVKTNHLIIRVGNPDEWCTQNCLPQDCLPVGISEVGNPEGNRKSLDPHSNQPTNQFSCWIGPLFCNTFC